MAVTVEDFKGYFTRNFPYLPIWQADEVYNTGDVCYYNNLFYESQSDNNTEVPIVGGELSANWVKIDDKVDNYVSDADIERAFGEATVNFNHALVGSCQEARIAFLYLAAFYLAYDLSVASGGAYGMVNFPATAVTVGSVHESYYVPQAYLEDPVLGFYAKNGFGQKYLSMVYPKLIGNVGVVAGWSLP